MTDNPPLVFLDTETTGLDPRIHQAWEVCWWHEQMDGPVTRLVPHTLEMADPTALRVGGYWDRQVGRCDVTRQGLARELAGRTLVGANPAFDAAFLTKYIGTAPWHYRLIDVCAGAMWVLGWDRPRSLIDTSAGLRDLGYSIPEPDHTAEGDVRATRAVYDAVRVLRDHATRGAA